jgi:uncharacterized membrane protein
VISSFVSTVIAFKGIEAAAKGVKLIGADNELGFPSSAFALVLFAVILAVGVAQLAGAQFRRGWWIGMTPLLLIGSVFEVWVLYLALVGRSFTVFPLVQLILFAGAAAIAIIRMPRETPSIALGVFLVVASVSGFFAAFRLVVDKVGTFTNPDVAPTCNVSVLVQCGKNLGSPQGSIFGFPNPLIGVGGWIAVLMVGIMILAGLRFARWFWIALNVGMLGALAFIVWLITQSIFDLHTLCPWCMATWSVVIPTFWLVTLYNLKEGNIPLPSGAVRGARVAYTYVPLITLICYLAVFLIAQVRLDVVNRF